MADKEDMVDYVWRAIRKVFRLGPEQPDVERKNRAMTHFFEMTLAEREAHRAECEARPTVAEVYAGCSVLVTGASGFMGRVLVEEVLRCCPDIGNVYVILRAKKGRSPQDRLRDLVDVPLFDRLRAEQPGATDKIVVLPGDTMELGLGLSREHQDLVQREVSYVFHFAASVRFDDPFQKAVFTNLRSARELVNLARGMPNLKALVHVSTAYTNINRDPVENIVYQPEDDWRDVLRWAEELDKDSLRAVDCLGHKVMGFQPNTYLYTKALAEKLMDDASREQLPVVVLRPTIVAPSVLHPLPGWIDNLTGLAGLWVAGVKGVIRCEFGPPTRFDSIPVDVAVKAAMLLAWCRTLGLRIGPGDGVDVVTVAVGLDIANSPEEFNWTMSDEGTGSLVPYPGVVRTPTYTVTSCWVWYQMLRWYHHILFGTILDLLARATGRRPRVLKIFRQLEVTLAAVRPCRGPFNFQPELAWNMQAKMNPKDEAEFGYLDLKHTCETLDNYRTMLTNTLRGILLYTLKERDDPVRNAKEIARIRWVMRAYHLAMAVFFYFLVVGGFKVLALMKAVRHDSDQTTAPIWFGKVHS